jgi:hypothetical protein
MESGRVVVVREYVTLSGRAGGECQAAMGESKNGWNGGNENLGFAKHRVSIAYAECTTTGLTDGFSLLAAIAVSWQGGLDKREDAERGGKWGKGGKFESNRM